MVDSVVEERKGVERGVRGLVLEELEEGEVAVSREERKGGKRDDEFVRRMVGYGGGVEGVEEEELVERGREQILNVMYNFLSAPVPVPDPFCVPFPVASTPPYPLSPADVDGTETEIDIGGMTI